MSDYPGRPLPKAEAVRDAKCDEGACLRATARQVGENGNPHKRVTNGWGAATQGQNGDVAGSK